MLIDRLKVKEIVNTTADASEALSKILALPTVDAVPVIRCKDCKWRNGLRCYHERTSLDDLVGENDFCSWGERKEDETN